MDIYIKWNNDKSGIRLPVNPENFDLSGSMNNTTVNIHNLGEIVLKGKRNLYSLSLSSFLPANKYNFLKGSFQDPLILNQKFKTLFENNETVHVVITDTDINGYFVFGDYSYGFHDKTYDIYYTFNFTEYRGDNATKKKRVSKSVSKNISYTWKKGDTWQKVAKAKLGSSAKWKTLRKQNKSVVEKAKKAYKKKHPKVKNIDEKKALIGYKVVIKS